MNETCKTLPIRKFNGKRSESESDLVALEEPLEIRIRGEPVSVTMRTPGHDVDLVSGLLFSEGILRGSEVPEIKKASANAVDVLMKQTTRQSLRLQHRFLVSSSCGLCGRLGVAQVKRRLGVIKSDVEFPMNQVKELTAVMRKKQEGFGITGGLHAAALFDERAEMLVVREDVGRHNAVDKVIGAWFRNPRMIGRPACLVVSGRTSFEILQKALAAKIPIVASVSAPSSLAVELASAAGITLIGFLRGETFNVYSRADRLK